MSEPKRGIKGRVCLSDKQVPAVRLSLVVLALEYNYLLDFSQKRYAADQTKTSKRQRSKELTRLTRTCSRIAV
jgi:hypothetical protein